MRKATEIRSITCRMVSYSVTCHPTQVNTPCFDRSQTGRYSIWICLPQRDRRLSWWLRLLVTYQDGLLAHQAETGPLKLYNAVRFQLCWSRPLHHESRTTWSRPHVTKSSSNVVVSMIKEDLKSSPVWKDREGNSAIRICLYSSPQP